MGIDLVVMLISFILRGTSGDRIRIEDAISLSPEEEDESPPTTQLALEDGKVEYLEEEPNTLSTLTPTRTPDNLKDPTVSETDDEDLATIRSDVDEILSDKGDDDLVVERNGSDPSEYEHTEKELLAMQQWEIWKIINEKQEYLKILDEDIEARTAEYEDYRVYAQEFKADMKLKYLQLRDAYRKDKEEIDEMKAKAKATRARIRKLKDIARNYREKTDMLTTMENTEKLGKTEKTKKTEPKGKDG